MLIAFAIGLLVGLAAAAAVARVTVKRAIARARVSERRARSAERLAEIGSMTSGLAHEIKNPLSTIGLNAQLLSEAITELDLPDNDRTRLTRRVGALRSETERLRGILEDFLQYAGELRLALRDTDINQLVEELADFFHVQAQSRAVRIRAELAPTPITARVDPDHLKQALLNLMLNAVAAMDRPDIAQRELILRTRALRADDNTPVAAIHVIDTGPGIDDDTIAKIFHPYFTTKAGGTGLGLPTARRIAEAHHGHLDVHAVPGTGTEFCLTVPIEPPAPPSTPTA